MPVTDFECQIARGQIGRYLGGGPLSPEALRGLEEHLAECRGCKAVVVERRVALLGALEGETPTQAVVSMPVVAESPLVSILRARSERPAEEAKPAPAAPRYAKEPEAKAKPVVGRPLILAAMLAAVLVGMSYVSRATGGHGALGSKASTIFAAETVPAAVPTPVAKPPVAAPAPKLAPPRPFVAKATEPRPPLPKPVVPKPVAPKPVAPKILRARPAPRRIPRPAPKRIAVKKPPVPAPAVRVYGLDGRPLKP